MLLINMILKLILISLTALRALRTIVEQYLFDYSLCKCSYPKQLYYLNLRKEIVIFGITKFQISQQYQYF